MWIENSGAVAVQGCGSVVNNTLASPGYPSHYPNNMDCTYSIPIPNGMAMEIYFHDFEVESHRHCGWDYVIIRNEDGQTIGVYCGERIGKTVLVTGDYAVIKFHSDGSAPKRGFFMLFTAVLLGNGTHPPFKGSYDFVQITNDKNETLGVYCGSNTGRELPLTGRHAVIIFHSDYSFQKRGFLMVFSFTPTFPPKVMVPDPVVRTLPGYKVSPCLVDGTFPINTAVVKNSKTLVNSATNIVTITLNEEGNYTCLARSNYGTDVKNFTVLFNDCPSGCSHSWSKYSGNTLRCSKVKSSLAIIKCTPTMTKKL
ncbi:hypothetical protein ACROYT_G020385 [Oculina patagonica]